MPLVLLWSNLGIVALPFFLALTLAAFLAFPLRRAAERSGMPRGREPCVGCIAERQLLERGYCRRRCAVNQGPAVPLTLFVACATLALFALLAPTAFSEFVLPYGLTGPGVATLLTDGLVGANAGAALLLASYLLQDLPVHREGLRRGSLVVALGSLGLTGFATVGPLRWIALLTPLALGGLVLSAAIEWRARSGRPAFGLRAVGLATAPLFLGVILAAIRIVQVVQLAHG